MRKLILIIGALGCLQISFSQDAVKPTRKTSIEKPKSISTSPSTSSKVALPDTMKGETIEHCDAMIQAIDYKVTLIQGNEELAKKAKSEGWFDQMAHNRAVFVSRKEYLLKSQTKN
jgi:hypothetical protein